MNQEAQNLHFSRNVPPILEQVQSYFNSLRVTAAEAEVFYFYYQGMDWYNEMGSATRDWIMAADDWVWNKGKHKLFEGGEKRLYTCKYCGTNNTSLANLTSMDCYRHPSGSNKGKHAPAL